VNTARLALLNILGLHRRLLGLVLLIVISAAISLSAYAVSHSARSAVDQKLLQGYGNRSLQLDQLGSRDDVTPLTSENLGKIRDIPGVERVEPRAQASFGYKNSQFGVLLYATTPRPSLLPPIISQIRPAVFPLSAKEIVLPAHGDGADLTSLLGHTITVEISRATGVGQGAGMDQKLHVVGIFDPKWQIDGPNAAYLDSKDVISWAALRAGVPTDKFTSTVGYDRVTVLAKSASDVPNVLAALQARGFAASTLQQQLQQLPTVLELTKSVSMVLLYFLSAIGCLGAYIVTSALSRQRLREFGILKAGGFSDRRIFRLLISEAVGVAIFAAVVTTIVGTLLASAMNSVFRHQESLRDYLGEGFLIPNGPTIAAVFVITVGVIVLGSLIPAIRITRLEPVDAIKSW